MNAGVLPGVAPVGTRVGVRDQEDALGMDVQGAAGPADGGEDAVLEAVDSIGLGGGEAAAEDLGVAGAGRPGGPLAATEVGPPAVARRPPLAGDDLGAPQAQADVIPPAHRRHRPDHLLLVAAPGVEQDQERIRIVRLVPLGDEPRLDERARPGP